MRVKSYSCVARVNIGQIILSIWCKDSNANAHVIQEAVRRARYKFPGRQKIIVSENMGFRNVDDEDYPKMKEDKLRVQCVVLTFHSNLLMTDIECRDGAYLQSIRGIRAHWK